MTVIDKYKYKIRFFLNCDLIFSNCLPLKPITFSFKVPVRKSNVTPASAIVSKNKVTASETALNGDSPNLFSLTV